MTFISFTSKCNRVTLCFSKKTLSKFYASFPSTQFSFISFFSLSILLNSILNVNIPAHCVICATEFVNIIIKSCFDFIELSCCHGQGAVASPRYLPRNEEPWKIRRPVFSTWTTAVRCNLKAQVEKSVHAARRSKRLQDTCESRRPKQLI